MGLTQVSTDGVKNDAITKTKIPANQIEASELADNAVDTNAIANNAVTAGKLASGVQTTINNNADNRVITGSGTANTLNGESGLLFDGTNLGLGITPDTQGGTVKSLQIGTATNLFNETSDDYTVLANNAYYDGSTNKRIKAQEVSRILMNAGNFAFERAGADSADSNITFQKIIETNENGTLLLKGQATSDNNRLQIRVDDTLATVMASCNSATERNIAFHTRNTGGSLAATITVNGIAMPSGKGIDFSASGNAGGMTNELFNDYEEGTWSPAPTFGDSLSGASYSIANCQYTKIGRSVTIKGGINFTNRGSSTGDFKVTGLPFNDDFAGSYSHSCGTAIVFFGPNADGSMNCFTSAAQLRFRMHNEANDNQEPQHSDFDDDTKIMFTATYFTNS